MANDRLALAGLAGAVLYVVSAFSGGVPPAPDAAITDVVGHYADHRAGVLLGVALAALAMVGLLVFLSRLWLAIEDRWLATLTLVSWVALLAVIVGGTAPLTALTWRGASSTDPRTVTLAFDLANLSTYALTAVFAALSIAAPILALGRRRVIPTWLVAVGVVEIAVNAVELAGIATRSGANTAGYAFGLGPFVWMVWVAGASVVLARSGR